MNSLKIENLSLSINKKSLFKSLSFELGAGEVLAIMGPSGSGKSSLLSYIAGALPEQITGTGSILLNGIQIEGLEILERKVGILFQEDLLFPHLTIGENLLFAMTERKRKQDRLFEVKTALRNANLEAFFDRKPLTLSGGQKARVSALRALLSKPKLMLLDEPFSKLDKPLRESFRQFVFSEIQSQNIPCILVTHDPDDIPFGSKIINLSEPRTEAP